MVTECCSESRMRSRMSRGVPEWSGGKDLYMGSPVLVAGKVSHFIGIVPGVPKGVRGSTGGVHLPWGATWAVGGAPWPIWAKGTSPTKAHAPRRGEGANPKGRWALRPTPGAPPLSPPLAATQMGSGGCRHPWGGTLEGAQPPPSPLYIVEVFGAANT